MEYLQFRLYFTLIPYISCDRIQGGIEITNASQFPFFGIFRSSYRGDRNYCGASLIHPSWGLSAGHCLPKKESEFNMLFFEEDPKLYMNKKISHDSQAIGKVYRHPKYYDENRVLRYDVALLKLKEPFELSPTVQPIQLATSPPTCEYVIGIGQGAIREGDNTLSSTPKYAKLKRVTTNVGMSPSAFYAIHDKNDKFEAAGETRYGDSGGPFICDGVSPPLQIGVFSGWYDIDHWHYNRIERSDIFLPWVKGYLPRDNFTKYLDTPKEKESKPKSQSDVTKPFMTTYFYLICISYCLDK